MKFDYPDWSTIHRPYWQEIFNTFDLSEPLMLLEVGSFEGRTTVWLADFLKHHPDSKLHCIDTWKGGEEIKRLNLGFDMLQIRNNFFNNISTLDTCSRIFVQETDSRRGLLSFGRSMFGMFDYIYLDGSHTQQDTLFDLTLALCLVRTGGVIVVDDYNNGMATNDTRLRPKKAVDFIVSTMNNDVKFYMTKEKQAVIVKR